MRRWKPRAPASRAEGLPWSRLRCAASLAQRSAEAAKEIKALIGRSVEQVEQGTLLVDQAGNTMGEIVNSIRRVTDVVGEITLASVEQSLGVQQIGDGSHRWIR